jgi:hypothetical protein
MSSRLDGGETDRIGGGRVVRPRVWRLPDRHILLGVSHASDDPALHRVFEVRASFDAEAGGWFARVGEQNLNEQREAWGPQLTNESAPLPFPTVAACLGNAVSSIIAMVDREALMTESESGHGTNDTLT